ncbi:MAG: hypothetical protein ABUL64_01745 [Singulisphaera sp.]
MRWLPLNWMKGQFPLERMVAMQQIKIFKGIENDLSTLEADVNSWLAEAEVDVIHIFGNIAPQSGATATKSGSLSHTEYPPSDVLLIVHYRKV